MTQINDLYALQVCQVEPLEVELQLQSQATIHVRRSLPGVHLCTCQGKTTVISGPF